MFEAGKPWEIVDVTYDDPRAHELVVKLEAAGLCHSDDHLRTGDTPMGYPIIGGHEGTGVVERVGPGVERFKAGDRVLATFIPACGQCRACSTGKQNMCDKGLNAGSGLMLDGTYRMRIGDLELGGFCALGTFAEHMVVSEYSVQILPDDIGFEAGALLSCGVPTGWGSAVRAGGTQPGDTVVIYGAGGVGSNAVQGAALAGALRIVVVDPNPLRHESARVFGATHTFGTHEEALEMVTAATWGRLAERAIITTGVLTGDTVEQALSIVGKRGRVVVTAAGRHDDRQISTFGNPMTAFEKTIQGALFGSCQPLSDLSLLMDLYRSGQLKLDELISRTYPLEQVNEGYDDLLAGRNIRGVLRIG